MAEMPLASQDTNWMSMTGLHYGKESKLFLVHVGRGHLGPASASEKSILLLHFCGHVIGMARSKIFLRRTKVHHRGIYRISRGKTTGFKR
jgi:hypothetical protein